MSKLILAATCLCALPIALDAASAADAFATSGTFSIIYTFTTSTPATPVDVGGGRQLTANRYLATTTNEDGHGFLHHVAGQCVNLRFTQRDRRMIDTNAYCQFVDRDGDRLFAEYTTAGPVPIGAIVNRWKFVAGTGKYDGIRGTAVDNNSGNLDDQGAYQACGRMRGSYAIVRAAAASEQGTHD